MTDFAIKNLMEIEDASSRPEVEARFSRKFLDSEHLGVSHFRYGPGFRAKDGHSHEMQEEAYVVLGGSGRIRLDDEVVEPDPLGRRPRRPQRRPRLRGRPGGARAARGRQRQARGRRRLPGRRPLATRRRLIPGVAPVKRR
jgi:hypothetical protein